MMITVARFSQDNLGARWSILRDTDKANNVRPIPQFLSPYDNGFISSLFVVGKGNTDCLTGVSQLHPMNWVLVKNTVILFSSSCSVSERCLSYIVRLKKFQYQHSGNKLVYCRLAKSSIFPPLLMLSLFHL